ncbi:unnamed protein product [Sphenostylis stenocarpa]|uniref:Uncharacterized protein n=1 Tax=Sphenostylis stenocarpa TaxID=92480 RepID=A0AA86T722_9FABA|nr:unnamed protein product [Sphenostylis stenocarpa]
MIADEGPLVDELWVKDDRQNYQSDDTLPELLINKRFRKIFLIMMSILISRRSRYNAGSEKGILPSLYVVERRKPFGQSEGHGIDGEAISNSMHCK